MPLGPNPTGPAEQFRMLALATESETDGLRKSSQMGYRPGRKNCLSMLQAFLGEGLTTTPGPVSEP